MERDPQLTEVEEELVITINPDQLVLEGLEPRKQYEEQIGEYDI